MSPPPRLFRPMNASRILAALLALATLALVAWLHRWSVTPLAWDRRDAWRAVRLDRWTGRAWIVEKRGLTEIVVPAGEPGPD